MHLPSTLYGALVLVLTTWCLNRFDNRRRIQSGSVLKCSRFCMKSLVDPVEPGRRCLGRLELLRFVLAASAGQDFGRHLDKKKRSWGDFACTIDTRCTLNTGARRIGKQKPKSKRKFSTSQLVQEVVLPYLEKPVRLMRVVEQSHNYA